MIYMSVILTCFTVNIYVNYLNVTLNKVYFSHDDLLNREPGKVVFTCDGRKSWAHFLLGLSFYINLI